MSGKPGRSGGPREGAGRPKIQRFTIEYHRQYLVRITGDMGQMGVIAPGTNQNSFTIKLDDGREIFIMR